MAGRRVHLAVALDGAGWHPGAWREPGARPADGDTACRLAAGLAGATAGPG